MNGCKTNNKFRRKDRIPVFLHPNFTAKEYAIILNCVFPFPCILKECGYCLNHYLTYHRSDPWAQRVEVFASSVVFLNFDLGMSKKVLFICTPTPLSCLSVYCKACQ